MAEPGAPGIEDGLVTGAAPSGFYNSAKKKEPKPPREPLSTTAKMAIAAAVAVLLIVAIAVVAAKPWEEPPPPLPKSCLKDTVKSDILWILDESSIKSGQQYRDLRNAIYDFTTNFTISSSQTRFGFVEFSDANPDTDPVTAATRNSVINFDEGDNPATLETIMIDRLKFGGGERFVSTAFDYARDEFFADSRNQRAVDTRFVIFVADGLPTEPLCYNASTYPGTGNCNNIGSPASCVNAPEGFSDDGSNCTNPYFPSINIEAAVEALKSLRSTISFRFYFLAITGQAGQEGLVDLFGDFDTNSKNVFQEFDKVFTTTFDDVAVDMATTFQLDCTPDN
uniref:VWFA domain-containing protein n=1 Tax=Aplanochytrium stocchinoi TaxID=215587 RepID=A0A6S8E2A0_9STRA|mmetsp:Transcript_20965/g.26748  ORF Transcript_20965/g.26748 Transcript_20965/m.26748 type:complete len:338 (+) Transcript_20965:238-1251(+)|eukprot:CAMPEP_0204866260 /NCGR_PEP_ID=MMETSP1348-20121228/16661_1 /ASSEMBLY_ACC=CAM_ASM_000700 /TAXON_ID=215587 /ORGANISM="Aplanochytrium stocchinoi, Strain GSBS06" /LENGTH=337 /DNA_ID=CAMNT_0052018069 /DNA_START=184 /DNA_END=1197 /DNA_ORIENTATION=+